MGQWGKQVAKKSHEAKKSDNDYYCSLDIYVRGAVLPRLVRARRRFAISRERPGTGGSPADSRECCGCCASTYAAGCLRRRCIGAGAVAVGTAAAVAATSPNWGWGGSSYDTDTGYCGGDPYYRRGALGARAAYYGRAPYAARTNDGHPWYDMRAYYQDGPWYGYSGWNDYAARNAIGCTLSTLVKGENGLMYRCQ
jgi:hypothetical protein